MNEHELDGSTKGWALRQMYICQSAREQLTDWLTFDKSMRQSVKLLDSHSDPVAEVMTMAMAVCN